MIFGFPRPERQKRERQAQEHQAGTDAFTAALLEQLPRLRRFAVALVGNASAADDLVQDTVERALERRAALVDIARIYGWIRSILHNLYIDEIRRQRSRGPALDIDDLAEALTPTVPADDRSEVRDFLRGMSALSADHRRILLLVGVEGMSYREIADELAVPLGTVMSRVARARAQLRAELDPPDSAKIMSFAPRTARKAGD